MLVIRFFRAGKKNQPLYKIVVTDKRKSSVKGTYVEEVGFFNPLKDKKFLRAERIKYWISVGAKPSATVHNLLISEKIIEGKKISKHKKSKKKEEKKAEVPATAAAAAPVPASVVKTLEAKPAVKEAKVPARNASLSDAGGEKAPEPVKTPETLKTAEVLKAPEAKPAEVKPPETKSAATPEKKPETK
jgi:small subunit ribosomal protein S16